jgi:hypothetical protein
MKSEHISPDRVRVDVTMPAAAWEAFEALVPRLRHRSREAVFDLVIAHGLREGGALADQQNHAWSVVTEALQNAAPGEVIDGGA